MASSILTRSTARAVSSSLTGSTAPLSSSRLLLCSNVCSVPAATTHYYSSFNRPVVNDDRAFRTHATLSPISLAANATSPFSLHPIKTFTTTTTAPEPSKRPPTNSSSSSPPSDATFDFNPENIPGWELVHSPPRKLPRGALVGTVVSDKMQKTVNVAVDRYRVVPIYRKRRKYTKKFMAHDEEEVCRPGDLVMIVPAGRKLSKHKTYIVSEVVKAKGQVY
mmetsp:Transcript_3439/g.4382  ORF Transcript_3439/g.4382 Transcript_3439/m.4382 type:complete len:221 (-) Transcript_3439:236-898(-)|eukprot:CAMPEP_0172481588 /NCGR_PEP_ID=MMETSP1066-20121228/7582_1 /TAXON_ID=671091 /ORGANISM="Coscinodiscus wailesii, Strain CCMP2513" /LENGTH=220 /DNA_ID=CAMNT_0013244025 /DNA_START=167 /DNA_END=829 /DNA_ORIENTATION=+